MITVEEVLKLNTTTNPEENWERNGKFELTNYVQAMKEYAKEAIKADRLNLLNHADVNYYVNDDGDNVFIVDQKTIISAPNIKLL